jgi:rare lipoprotein A
MGCPAGVSGTTSFLWAKAGLMIMTIKWQYLGALLASLAIGLAGCGSNPSSTDGVDTGAKAPAAGFEARSACGNESTYTIEGKSYQVMASAAGYTETGTAGWYGAEFQGTETAGCEVFDMYAYSAAHRTLPLPSFVRVTHPQNGKSIIVRVNDRGPFEGNDLIQLSFAAANALGITQKQGVPVKLDALSPEQFKGQLPEGLVVTDAGSDGRSLDGSRTSGAAIRVLQREKQPLRPVDKSKVYYIVAGAWPQRDAAIDMFVRLTSVGLSKTELATAQDKGKTVHQIRIGPLYDQDQIDNVKDTLQSNGLASFKVVAQ